MKTTPSQNLSNQVMGFSDPMYHAPAVQITHEKSGLKGDISNKKESTAVPLNINSNTNCKETCENQSLGRSIIEGKN